MKGVDILIYANTGTDEVPVWTSVGGQRGATLSEKTDTFEVTHKASGGYKEYEYSYGDWTISCDGLYISGNTGYAALVSAMRNKTKIKARWKEESSYTYEGTCLVTGRDLEGPYDGEVTYSIELQGSGAPTILPDDESNNLSGLTGIEQQGTAALVLVPAFAAGTYAYVASVDAASGWVKLTSSAAAGVITVNDAVVSTGVQSGELTLGAAGTLTTVIVTVTETDKSAKTYTVTVARAAS